MIFWDKFSLAMIGTIYAQRCIDTKLLSDQCSLAKTLLYLKLSKYYGCAGQSQSDSRHTLSSYQFHFQASQFPNKSSFKK